MSNHETSTNQEYLGRDLLTRIESLFDGIKPTNRVQTTGVDKYLREYYKGLIPNRRSRIVNTMVDQRVEKTIHGTVDLGWGGSYTFHNFGSLIMTHVIKHDSTVEGTDILLASEDERYNLKLTDNMSLYYALINA